MSIYKKTIIMVLCTTIVFMSLVYLVSDSIYRSGFEELEMQSTENNVIRVKEALTARLEALDTFCYDWSVWDDTYSFAREFNRDYIDRNFHDETFISSELNVVSIFNSSGEMVYIKAFDLVDQKEMPVPKDFIEKIYAEDSPNQTSITGVILYSGQPMLISSRPILTSLAEGPSAGTFIMGRILDTGVIDSLSITTRNSIELLPITDDFDPTDYNIVDQMDHPLPVFVKAFDKNTISGYTYIEDFSRNPIFILKVNMARDTYAQGMKALTFLQYSLVVFGLVFCVTFIFLIRKLILSRLTALGKWVSKIGSSSDVSSRVPVSGNDELSELARNINGMLTSLENAEIKQRSQQELISHIMDNTPNAVLVVDKFGNIILANRSFCELFILDTSDISGKNIQSLPSISGLVPKIQAFLASQSTSFRSEFQYGLNGRKKSFVVGFTRMNEDDLFFLVLTDVSEEKLQQEKLHLTDRLVSVGQMASGVAHELNNPLTSIIGLSAVLTKQDVPEDLKEDIASINSEARRCAAIVQNLLTFARKRPSARAPVDVRKIIEDVLKLRAYEHKVNNISVDTELSRDLPAVSADYFQMQQVFLNIILNAETAMIDAHGKGILKISAQPVNSHVTISFSDNGPGISEENMRSLFNPFFTTKDVGKGTGLGLSICYGIVTDHGGKIYAESEFGKGAAFIIELPAPKQ